MSERPLWRMVAGRKAGPYDPAKLRPLVKDGRVGPLDRFSYDGVNWQPANAFPELLRPPTVVITDSVEEDFSPLSEEPGVAGGGVLLGPPSLPGRQQPSGDDAALLKAIYSLIAFGGGTLVLLVIYMIVQSFRAPRSVPRPPLPTPAVVRQEKPRGPAVNAQQEVVVDVDEAPRKDDEIQEADTGLPAGSAESAPDSPLKLEPTADENVGQPTAKP